MNSSSPLCIRLAVLINCVSCFIFSDGVQSSGFLKKNCAAEHKAKLVILLFNFRKLEQYLAIFARVCQLLQFQQFILLATSTFSPISHAVDTVAVFSCWWRCLNILDHAIKVPNTRKVIFFWLTCFSL